MPNPAAVADGAGEWFEVFNTGPVSVDLDGWRIAEQEVLEQRRVAAVPLPDEPEVGSR